MATWVRNLFLLTVLLVWSVAVSTMLIRGTLPDPLIWSVPTTLWLAMNPPVPKSWRRSEDVDVVVPQPIVDAKQEGAK